MARLPTEVVRESEVAGTARRDHSRGHLHAGGHPSNSTRRPTAPAPAAAARPAVVAPRRRARWRSADPSSEPASSIRLSASAHRTTSKAAPKISCSRVSSPVKVRHVHGGQTGLTAGRAVRELTPASTVPRGCRSVGRPRPWYDPAIRSVEQSARPGCPPTAFCRTVQEGVQLTARARRTPGRGWCRTGRRPR